MSTQPESRLEAFKILYKHRVLPDDVLDVLDGFEKEGKLNDIYMDMFADQFQKRLLFEQSERERKQDERLEIEPQINKKSEEFQKDIEKLEKTPFQSKKIPEPWEKQGTAVVEQEQNIVDSLREKVSELQGPEIGPPYEPRSSIEIMQDKFADLKIQEPNLMNVDEKNYPTWEEHLQTKQKEFGKELGLGTRAIAEGVAGVPGIIYDPMSYIVTPLFNLFVKNKRKPKVARKMMSEFLDELGVPKPETESEKLMSQFNEFFAGSIGEVSVYNVIRKILSKSISPVTRKVIEILESKPGTQAVSAGVAGIASEKIGQEAQKSELTPGEQIAARLIGSTAAGMATGKAMDLSKSKIIPNEIPSLTSITKEKASEAGLKSREQQIKEINDRREIIKTAKEFDIPLYKHNLEKPKTPFLKYIQRMKESIPIGIGNKLVNQEEEKVRAIKSWLSEKNADSSGSLLEPIYNNLIENHKATLNMLTNRKKNIINSIDNKAIVNYPNTKMKIRDLYNSNKRMGSAQPLLKLLKEQDEAFKNGSFNLELFDEKRSRIGELLDRSELDEIRTAANKAKKELYSATKKDMALHIKKYAGVNKLKEWNDTFSKIARMIEVTEKTSLKQILRKGTVTPETVKLIVHSNYTSIAKELYKKLDDEGKHLVKSELLRKAYNEATNGIEFSPSKFRHSIEDTANTLNIFLSQKEIKQYEGLNKLIQVTERSEQIKKGKGGLYPFLGVGIIGTLSAELLGGYGHETAAIVAAPMVIGLLSRITENPTITKLLIKIPDMIPGSKEEEAAFKRVIDLIQREAENIKEFEKIEELEEDENYIKSKKLYLEKSEEDKKYIKQKKLYPEQIKLKDRQGNFY